MNNLNQVTKSILLACGIGALLVLLSLIRAKGADGVLQNLNGTTTQGGAVTVTNVTLYGTPTIIPFNSSWGLIGNGDSLNTSVSPKLFYTLTNQISNWQRFGAVYNFSFTGAMIADLNAGWTTNEAPAIATMKGNGQTNIIVLLVIGANNLGTTTFPTDWDTYVNRAQSSNVQVIATTILPQTNSALGILTNWFKFNQHIRQSTLPEYVVDWAKLFPVPSDTNWFLLDGAHLTTNGYYRAALAVDAALKGQTRNLINADPQLTANVDGNIGVNTHNPQFTFDVGGSARATDLFRADRAGPAALYAPFGGITTSGNVTNFMAGKLALADGVGAYTLDVGSGTIGAVNITLSSFAQSTRADHLAFWAPNGGITCGGLVNSTFAGNVGIGMTPVTALDVTGSARVSSIIEGDRTDNLALYAPNGGVSALGASINNRFVGPLAFPTNYVAADFVPLAGYVKICWSNGIPWKVSQISTQLLNSALTP